MRVRGRSSTQAGSLRGGWAGWTSGPPWIGRVLAHKWGQAAGLMMTGIFIGGLLHFILDYEDVGLNTGTMGLDQHRPTTASQKATANATELGARLANVSTSKADLARGMIRVDTKAPKVAVHKRDDPATGVPATNTSSTHAHVLKKHKTRRRRLESGMSMWGILEQDLPLTIFEPYDSRSSWDSLRPLENSLYRGIVLRSGHRRPGSDDIDAPALLFVLEDGYYRNTLCEVGAILALGKHVDYVDTRPWVGVQYPARKPWAAETARTWLSTLAEERLLEAIHTNQHGEMAFYFWSMQRKPNSEQLYGDCDAAHNKKCSHMFRDAFLELFYQTPHQMQEPPPMPTTGAPWAYPNGWAVHKSMFVRFVSFARLFIVALDNVYFDAVHNQGHCPLANNSNEQLQEETSKHCFCFLLDRLASIWAYHSGLRMYHVNPVSGTITEAHPVHHRQMWSQWFGGLTLRLVEREFSLRQFVTPPNARDLLRRLGLQDAVEPLV